MYIRSVAYLAGKALCPPAKFFYSALAGLALGLSLGLCAAPPALAEHYIIDKAAAQGGKTYNSLEDLRNAIAVLQDGDTITLKNSDASLTAPFGGADVVDCVNFINGTSGSIAISPKAGSQGNFIVFDGQENSVSFGSGVIVSGFRNTAISVNGEITGGISNVTFMDNRTLEAPGIISANGGAINTLGIAGGINNSVFIGNTAEQAGGAISVGDVDSISGSTFSDNVAAFGGAIAAGSIGLLKDSVFTGNKAVSYSTVQSDSVVSFGGALSLEGSVISPQGEMPPIVLQNVIFSDNAAYGDTSIRKLRRPRTGSGGAIISLASLRIDGARFTDNHASIAGPGAQPFEGAGGAVALLGTGERLTLNINATPGDAGAVIFSGNTHNPAGQGETANSISFLGVEADKVSEWQAGFDVADGATFHMLDPMFSQEDGLIWNGDQLGGVALAIAKTGPGTWVLAGRNDMRSATDWRVDQGALHLVLDEKGAPAWINLSNTSNKSGAANPANFTLASGASLLLEPGLSPHKISGQSIVLEDGSKVGLAGFRYGPKLENGSYTALALDAPKISNASGVIAESGVLAVGAYDYAYDRLAWDEARKNLTFNVVYPYHAATQNPVRSGKPALTAASHIAYFNPAMELFFNRMNEVFADLSGPYAPSGGDQAVAPAAGEGPLSHSGAGRNRSWITPFYSDTSNYSSGGYDLSAPGVALGYDRILGERAMAGVGAAYARPDFSGQGTTTTADVYTFALYGGARLPADIDLFLRGGYARTEYDQTRRVPGLTYRANQYFEESYDSDYGGDAWFAGLELGRDFKLGRSDFTLRPIASYDYIRLSVDGYNEYGQNRAFDSAAPEEWSSGVYALKSDSFDQDLHRVKGGGSLRYTVPGLGLKASGEVYYLGVFGDTKAKAMAGFVNDPGNPFTIAGNGLDQDNLGLGARVAYPVSERFEIDAGYGTVLGANSAVQQAGVQVVVRF